MKRSQLIHKSGWIIMTTAKKESYPPDLKGAFEFPGNYFILVFIKSVDSEHMKISNLMQDLEQ